MACLPFYKVGTMQKIFNIEHFKLANYYGHLVPNGKGNYQFVSLCGREFLVKGKFKEFLGAELIITGLVMWGENSENELIPSRITRLEKKRA